MADEARRAAVAWHEAGHATAAWLAGLEFEQVELIPEAEQEEQEAQGRVTFDADVPNLEAAIHRMVVALIGDPTYRLAWASGLIAKPSSTEFVEAPLDVLLALPTNGSSSPKAREATLAVIQHDDQPDAALARRLAEMFTSAPDETEHLLKFARARATGLASTERFLALAGALVNALLRCSSMTWADAGAVLERAARIYDIGTQMSELFPQRDEE